jgi:1-acyl-sn-glycerol-3-phosphate acyltransferase
MKDWNYENEQWVQLPAHIKHLPLFTRHFDLTSFLFRVAWGIFLKGIGFRFYVRLRVNGDFHKIYRSHPRLILISNHASHLDAVSIAAAVPFVYWKDLFITAAKDYWFRNPLFTFFSKHCLGAIPIDRQDRKSEAIKLCVTLLQSLERIWLILFPEGGRSPDGTLQPFKRGVSLFSQKTNTPVLFLFLEGNSELWPKGRLLPFPGRLVVHVGPIHEPAPVADLYEDYKKWVRSFAPDAVIDAPKPDTEPETEAESQSDPEEN